MGMHATIHGKTTEDFNEMDGKWIPIRINSSGQLSIQLLNGELSQFNRLAGGPIWQYALVTSDATGLNIANGPAIFGGIYLISAGTMASVYDSTTAAGNVIVPSTTATVNYGGGGIMMNNGITCDWTSGTWLVLYVPAA
jgi:hypothetical protein